MSETNGIEKDEHQQHVAPKAVAESAESLGPRAVSKESLSNEPEAQSNRETNKIKFTKTENESAVHIGDVDVAFAGMGKEELMKYANDPFWVKIRWILFMLFWLGWVAMLVAATVIVVLAPKCPPPKPLTYWQKGAVYQTEVKSFQDGQSNQDGKGDIKGVLGRLGHLEQLGVNMLVLPPIFKQENVDVPYGFAIEDFQDVSPVYGALDDLKDLVQAAEAHKGMKVLLDLIPNHSSKMHGWFVNSSLQIPNYSDYYIWKDCNPPILPDDSINVFNEPAWTYEENRKQCYYHAYGSNQPDLNLRNPKVQEELDNIVRFWLDQGVTGFRLLSTPFLFEENNKTMHLPENYEYVGHIRSILKEYENRDGKERILLVDPDKFASFDDLKKYYGSNETNPLADLPINNFLIYDWEASNSSASQLRRIISDYLIGLPSWGWPTWVVSNRDRSRIASRLGKDREDLSDAISMLQMLLPGTPLIYYGDEIAMQDVADNRNEDCSVGIPLTESYRCNKARSPFQWNETPNNAGFTNATDPWYPVASEEILKELNAKAQIGKPESPLNIYRELVALRSQPAIMHGNISFPEHINTNNENILSFIRIRKGAPGYIVILNLSPGSQSANFECVPEVPTEAQVALRSSTAANNQTAKGETIKTNSVTLEGHQGLVLSFAPDL